MLLRNFYNIQMGKAMGANVEPAITIKTTANASTSAAVTSYGIKESLGKIAGSNNYAGIHLGSGTEAVTFDDYKLSKRIDNANFSASASVTMTLVDESIVVCTSICTITNISANALTITEVGVSVQLDSSTRSSLIERTVLDSPITLQPNEVGQLTYSIRYQLKTE